MDKPHPDLIPYLLKYQISWKEFAFTPRGRSKKGDERAVEVRKLKSDIVTDLHSQGTSWKRMCEITGKSVGFIQKHTKATWNLKSRQNSKESAAKVGRSRKGEKKPWLSEQMKAAWKDGDFDFHKGRIRSPEECQTLRDSYTPAVRKQMSLRMKKRWSTEEYRKKLLDFHRSPEERARRSIAQSERMKKDPIKWTRGRGQYVNANKHSTKIFWVRSSYEVAAVSILERDLKVKSYKYECPYSLENKKRILPDFTVTYTDGSVEIIEIKASWVLNLPDEHPLQAKLRMYEKALRSSGYPFTIWTEKDVLKDELSKN